ncbi:4657_t:CDS:1, partial [Racocetra fulgida]
MFNLSTPLTEIFASLYDFLKTASSDKITISNIITQQWNCFKVQTEEDDLECFKKILKETVSQINNGE